MSDLREAVSKEMREATNHTESANAALDEAERKAHEACPCKFDEASGCRYRDGKGCACSTTMGHWKCGWPGHADIRTLRREAYRAGLEAAKVAAMEVVHPYSAEGGEIADAIRALEPAGE